MSSWSSVSEPIQSIVRSRPHHNIWLGNQQSECGAIASILCVIQFSGVSPSSPWSWSSSTSAPDQSITVVRVCIRHFSRMCHPPPSVVAPVLVVVGIGGWSVRSVHLSLQSFGSGQYRCVAQLSAVCGPHPGGLQSKSLASPSAVRGGSRHVSSSQWVSPSFGVWSSQQAVGAAAAEGRASSSPYRYSSGQLVSSSVWTVVPTLVWTVPRGAEATLDPVVVDVLSWPVSRQPVCAVAPTVDRAFQVASSVVGIARLITGVVLVLVSVDICAAIRRSVDALATAVV